MTQFLTQSEYADHANVNKSTVSRWIKNGRICKEPSGLIDPRKADTQRDSTESPLVHHQARKAQIDAEKSAKHHPQDSDQPSINLPAADQISLKYKYATMREREHKAEIAALDLDKQAGMLVERREVELLLADFGATLRNLLENLPEKLGPVIAAHRGDTVQIVSELNSAAREVLEEISAHMQRKQEG